MEKRIYVLLFRMSSSERVAETKMIDDNTKEIVYAFPRSVRMKIERVRNKYRREFEERTVNFYGLRLADEDTIPEAKEIVKNADKELKEIDPTLSATLLKVPISEQAIEEGELYSKILYAIQYQVVHAIFNRVKDLKSDELRKNSKESIREMLDKMRRLNILRDERIDTLIDRIEKMLDMKVQEMRNQILEELQYIERELEAI